MDIKMFYKSQVEVAEVINQIIDGYWNNEIEEIVMFRKIDKLLKNNHSKVIKYNEYTAVIKQKCGKRRLDVVTKVIEMFKQENV
jgi:uncharacterized protein (TIGR04540 family)